MGLKERNGRTFVLTMVESLWDTQYGAEQQAQELNDSSLTCPWGTMGWNVRRHAQ